MPRWWGVFYVSSWQESLTGTLTQTYDIVITVYGTSVTRSHSPLHALTLSFPAGQCYLIWCSFSVKPASTACKATTLVPLPLVSGTMTPTVFFFDDYVCGQQRNGRAAIQVMAGSSATNIRWLLFLFWPFLSWPHAPLLPNWVRGDKVAGLWCFTRPLRDLKVSWVPITIGNTTSDIVINKWTYFATKALFFPSPFSPSLTIAIGLSFFYPLVDKLQEMELLS